MAENDVLNSFQNPRQKCDVQEFVSRKNFVVVVCGVVDADWYL